MTRYEMALWCAALLGGIFGMWWPRLGFWVIVVALITARLTGFVD